MGHQVLILLILRPMSKPIKVGFSGITEGLLRMWPPKYHNKILGLSAVLGVQKFILLLYIFIPVQSDVANAQSYDKYHQYILKAEEFYFLKNKADSSLVYYAKCFENFDFIFARDAINAFQIAYKE